MDFDAPLAAWTAPRDGRYKAAPCNGALECGNMATVTKEYRPGDDEREIVLVRLQRVPERIERGVVEELLDRLSALGVELDPHQARRAELLRQRHGDVSQFILRGRIQPRLVNGGVNAPVGSRQSYDGGARGLQESTSREVHARRV